MKKRVLIRRLTVVFLTAVVIFFGILTVRAVEVNILYPLKFEMEVKECSDKYGLDRILVFALINAESGFDEKAVSDKGAMGLMQLKKETAEYVAMLYGIENFDLFCAKDNIEMGCLYLSYLYGKFDSDSAVICAYNAGEGRVKGWLKDESISPDGKTVKSVPYAETEKYLKSVNKNYAKYKKLYSKLLDKV